MTKIESIIVKEATSLFKNEMLLRSPMDTLTDEEALYAWSCLDLIEKKLLTARKAELRDHLLALADKYGEVSSEGHKNYQPEGSDGNIQKQCRKGKVSLDTEKLVALLQNRGFQISRLYTMAVSEEIVEALVVTGEISTDEIKECSSVAEPSYALIVKKPSEVESLAPKAKKALKK